MTGTGAIPERWAYAGRRPAKNSGLLGAWVPEDSTGDDQMRYWPEGSRVYVIGGIYELQVIRSETGSMTRRGDPHYTGDRLSDHQLRARWEIEDRHASRAAGRERAEKRHRKDTVLATALIPLQQIAAGLKTRSQLAALQEYVAGQLSESFYTGKAPPSKGPSPYWE